MFPVIDRIGTGRRIRQLMDARHITARDVQEHLALESVQGVYYWLNGRSLPTVDNLYALSQLLEVPMDAMICGSRTCRPARPPVEYLWYGPAADIRDRRPEEGTGAGFSRVSGRKAGIRYLEWLCDSREIA